MKKILVKAYLVKNFGDDLFLKILFDRYKNVNWVIEANDKTYKKIFETYDNVTIISGFFYKILKKLRIVNIYYKSLDAIVYIGGSIFMQLDNWYKQYNDRKNIFKIFKNKEKFIVGANFGPYNDKVFYECYKELFNQCNDVCFRENYSYKLFESLNNVRKAPDIVFQLKSPKIEKIKNTIGISLISIKNRKDLKKYEKIYIEKISDLVKKAIEDNNKITFFSFCEFQGDMDIIRDVIECIDVKYHNSIEIINYDGDIEGFLEKFKSMENIIGTRFHACILSQVFNQGLYPILYSNKTYNVIKDIGLDKYYTHIDNMENMNIEEVINIISNNKINDNSIFIEAEKQFEVLDKYVESY